MKSLFARNTGIAAVVLVASSLLAGCGQPGPLYMPKPPTKPAPPPAPQTPSVSSVGQVPSSQNP